jgi:hypothetical protein
VVGIRTDDVCFIAMSLTYCSACTSFPDLLKNTGPQGIGINFVVLNSLNVALEQKKRLTLKDGSIDSRAPFKRRDDA